MPSIALSTGKIHYLEQGQGVPLALLHANPGESLDFAAVLPALSQHYRALALDWPGYGQSEMPQRPERADVLRYCHTLREWLSALSLPAAIFIGNSIGGNAAARLASEMPESVLGLVLVAPGGFTPHSFLTRTFCRWQGSRFAFSPYRFAKLYLKQRTATIAARLERAATIQATVGCLTLNRAMWRSFGSPANDLRPLVERIHAPTMLLFGARDPVIPANKDGTVAARCIPSARVVVLPCGHASFAEVPELFFSGSAAVFTPMPK